MEIKSSLLNDEDFVYVKQSLIEVSEKDHKENFRIKTLDYINAASADSGDKFFYDMMEFIRFLDPNDQSIAYTTPDNLIYLNCPGNAVGEDMRIWDFIYDHECLHQLWDTFAVGDRLKANNIEYDHELLNIASDCVINDYLKYIRRKKPFDKGIFPETLKELYGIEYNRKIDTQYTLYLKLLEHPEAKKLSQNAEYGQQGQNGQQGQDGQQGQSGGKGKGQDGQQGKDGQHRGGSEHEDGEPGQGWGEGKRRDNPKGNETDADLAKIREKARAVIDKYSKKIAGDFGTFIEKCKASSALCETGLQETVQRGNTGWSSQMTHACTAFVKKMVYQKNRQYKRTYSRIRRGSGFVNYGEPLKPGKKPKENSLLINVAFYIDRSGSMTGIIDNVFDAAYTMAEGLKKQFGKEKVVDDIAFKMFYFDENIREIPWGKRVNADNGNCDFAEIVDFIKENTQDYLINIVITDAQFDVDIASIDKFLEKINGMLTLIVNSDSYDFQEIENHNKSKVKYIKADPSFSLS